MLKNAPVDLKLDLLQKKMKGKFLMNTNLVRSFFGKSVFKNCWQGWNMFC